MNLEKYKFIINKKNAQCAVVLNDKKNDLSFLQNTSLSYQIQPQEKQLVIKTKQGEKLTLLNLDDEMIYYAFKTIHLTIFLGTIFPNKKINAVIQAVLE